MGNEFLFSATMMWDGITATVLMSDFLSKAGGFVDSYIPHREEEGYGLQVHHIQNFSGSDKYDLIVTVDCGAGSREALEAAIEAGMDVIVTDHHNVSPDFPNSLVMINPKRPDCSAGFDSLSGVGVAFSLLICLRAYLRETGFWEKSVKKEPNLKQYCDLVALGTVADMVPLINNNRILVKSGLNIINENPRYGLRALIETCKLENNIIDAEDIAFKLAPRLNAAGRMGHAGIAAELLMSENMMDASRIADILEGFNIKRQESEKKMLAEVRQHIERNPHILQNQTLVLAKKGWNEGVLGIVASKVVDEFRRPAIMISIKDAVSKGSGRSLPGLDLYEALHECAGSLMEFGGHPMAAGIKIKTVHIDPFATHFEKVVKTSTASKPIVSELPVDYRVDFDEIDGNLLDELERLKPYGEGNPEPIFVAENIFVSRPTIVGENHRKMLLSQSSSNSGKKISAIHFNTGPDHRNKDFFDRIAFRLRWNRWNSNKIMQIVIEDC